MNKNSTPSPWGNASPFLPAEGEHYVESPIGKGGERQPLNPVIEWEDLPKNSGEVAVVIVTRYNDTTTANEAGINIRDAYIKGARGRAYSIQTLRIGQYNVTFILPGLGT